jgi:hypothetical protein
LVSPGIKNSVWLFKGKLPSCQVIVTGIGTIPGFFVFADTGLPVRSVAKATTNNLKEMFFMILELLRRKYASLLNIF